MINVNDLLKVEFLEDKSCKVRYKLSYGEIESESIYLERTLQAKETQRFIKKLSEIVDNYNKG